MSSHSDRYARWFGTRVPSSSGTVHLIIAAILGLVLSIPFHSLWTLTNPLVFIVVLSLTSAALHFVVLVMVKSHLETPIEDPRLDDIVREIERDSLISGSTRLWIRESNEAFITSTYTALFDAVIVSRPMVDRILASGENGKVLLAFHFFRIPRSRWLWHLVGCMTVFVGIVSLMDSIVIPALSAAPNIYGTGWIMSVLSMGLIIPVLIIAFARPACWKHDTAFETTLETYGIHPQVAKVEVEKETTLDEDERRAVLWGVLEWERKKRGSRRAGMTILALIATWGLPMMVVLADVSAIYYYSGLFTVYLPLAAITLALVVFLFMRSWDKRAMASILYATEGAEEPIWMD
ncbi:MAG: hypothetical protein ACP6KW_06620 [Candidatus Thorarchaeota archaeon]